METFLGDWQIQSCDQHEELMEAYGVPEEYRPAYRRLDAIWSYKKTGGDRYIMALEMGGQTKENIFIPGEPFEDKDLLGSPLKTTVVVKGGKLIETYQFPHNPRMNYKMTYELLKANNLKGNQRMNLTVSIKGLDVHCVLKKLPEK